jgi:hypothetical protein
MENIFKCKNKFQEFNCSTAYDTDMLWAASETKIVINLIE